MLAHVLVQRVHGARPVVLVGFSLGALLVYECLLEMARLSEEGVALPYPYPHPYPYP